MIEKHCPVCNRVYLADPKRLKYGRQTTCSRKCSYQLRAKKLENNLTLICGFCGNSFTRPISRIKGKHGNEFCSPACHYAARSTGKTKRVIKTPYKITEAGRAAWKIGGKKTAQKRRENGSYVVSDKTKAKISTNMTKQLSEGKIKLTSKIEDRFAADLMASGAVFTRQFVIRNPGGTFAAIIDFYFADLKIALEFNGTYWHVDPRFYPIPNEMQKRFLFKAERKRRLLESMGISLIEVWEYDYKIDPIGTIKRILKAVAEYNFAGHFFLPE